MDQDQTPAEWPSPDPAPAWSAPPQTAVPKRSAVALRITAAAALLVVGGVGGYLLPHHHADKPAPASPTKPPAVSLFGTLTLTSVGQIESPGDGSCEGRAGYSDIGEGAQVVITDDSGKTLTITHLEAGSGDQFSCEFAFRADVPSGRGYYGVQVSHRGVVKEPETDLGAIAISLGD
jgi:hypothetical protein